LSQGKGILICQLAKDALKADFENKPSSLIRETLYELFGKEAFATCTVTSRGKRFGTYGIEDNVLLALWGK